MNLLQQLSEIKLLKEEIEALIETAEFFINAYDDEILKINIVIDVMKSKDIESNPNLKVVVDGIEDSIYTNKTLEELISMKEEILHSKEIITNLRSSKSKLEKATKLFE